MSDTGGWTTPEGWGGPAEPPRSSPGLPSQGYPGGLDRGYPAQRYPGHPEPGGPRAGDGLRPAAEVPLRPGVVPLRPLGLGEVLDGAVGVLRRYPRPTLGLAAIVALATSLLNLLLVTTAFRPLFELDQQALANGDTAQLQQAVGGAAAGGALTLVLGLLSGAVLTGAITAVVGKAVLGAPITFGQAWRLVLPRLPALIGLAVLTLVLVYAALLAGLVLAVVLIAVGGAPAALLGVPLGLAGVGLAIYLYGRLALAPCALVLEGAGVRTSLTRSGVLVKGDWWRVVGILILTLLIGQFVASVLQVPFTVFGAGSFGGLVNGQTEALSARALIATTVGGLIAGTLVAPFTAGVRALLYVDRRMRAEGLDVSLSAAATRATTG